jgi:hypothetical protein
VYSRTYGNCPRCSLDITEEVCVDYEILPQGSDSRSDTSEKVNGNMEAFHAIDLVASILSSYVLCRVFHAHGIVAIFITIGYGNLHKP